MTNKSACNAVAADSIAVPSKHRWLHRFLILNALLIGLPIALMIAVWGMLTLNGVQVSGSSGSLELDTVLICGGIYCDSEPDHGHGVANRKPSRRTPQAET